MAKVVSHSPLRPNPDHISLKNTLDAPFKSKWPKLSRTVIAQILEEVERSLCGIRVKSARRKRKKSHKLNASESSESTKEISEPLAKRHCLEKDSDGISEKTSLDKESGEANPSRECISGQHETNPDIAHLGEENAKDVFNKKGGEKILSSDGKCLQSEVNKNDDDGTAIVEISKVDSGQTLETKSEDSVERRNDHLVIGINGVTRLLEQGRLAAGLVCSSSPSLLYKHLLPLAAMGGVPFAAVPDLSDTISQCLGIKRAMCIGIKKSGDGKNHFSPLCAKISELVEPISLPWMRLPDRDNSSGPVNPSSSALLSVTTGDLGTTTDFKDTCYHSLQIKKLRTRPNSAKKCKPK